MQKFIDEVEEVQQYRYVGKADIDQAAKFINRANERLAKAGIADRFEAINSEFGETEVYEGEYPFQVTRKVEFWSFDLNVPSIGYGGWTFVASVSFEEGGTLVNAVPGQDLTDWTRPEAHLCEHCGTIRNRTKSYVLRNDETGEYLQVGSSCLVLFLGVKPALWAVGLELPAPSDEDYSSYPARYDRNLWLAITLSVTERGAKFVSKARSGEQNGPASSSDVAEVYTPNRVLMSKSYDYKAWVEKHQDEAQRILAEEPELIEALIEAGNGVGLDSDYGMNLAVALASETVSSRALGILTSVVSVWHKAEVKKVEKALNPVASGFLGEVKERVRGIRVTVTFVKYLEGDYGTTSLIKFRTEDGHLAVWFASGYKEFEVGQELVIDGTVKKHDVYDGQDQTVLTRVTVKG